MRGARRRLPFSASPPFAPFVSEFSILGGAFTAGRYASGVLFLVFLLVIFIGMGNTVLKIVQGRVSEETVAPRYREVFLTVAPILCYMALVLVIGLFFTAAPRGDDPESCGFFGEPMMKKTHPRSRR